MSRGANLKIIFLGKLEMGNKSIFGRIDG